MPFTYAYSLEYELERWRWWVLRDGVRVWYSPSHNEALEYIKKHGGECVQLALF